MNGAQIGVLVFLVFDLCFVAHMHGKPKDDYNFWISLAANILWFILIGCGGFWKGAF